MTELQEKVLTAFANNQCWEDDGTLILNDEASVMTYRFLEGDVHLSKEELRPVVLSLRNEKFVELVTAFDRDYVYRAGSGYFLTEKGRAYCELHRLSDELSPLPETPSQS